MPWFTEEAEGTNINDVGGGGYAGVGKGLGHFCIHRQHMEDMGQIAGEETAKGRDVASPSKTRNMTPIQDAWQAVQGPHDKKHGIAGWPCAYQEEQWLPTPPEGQYHVPHEGPGWEVGDPIQHARHEDAAHSQGQ